MKRHSIILMFVVLLSTVTFIACDESDPNRDIPDAGAQDGGSSNIP